MPVHRTIYQDDLPFQAVCLAVKQSFGLLLRLPVAVRGVLPDKLATSSSVSLHPAAYSKAGRSCCYGALGSGLLFNAL